MTALTAFTYGDAEVRTVMVDDQVWFVAADVCAVLGIANSRDALGRLDDDEKGVGTTDTLGGPQQVALVSEPGLYGLTWTSRKAQAAGFRRWIKHEVLPAIRRTGQYGAPTALSFEEMTAHVIEGLSQRIAAAEARAKELESPAQAWTALSSADGDYTVSDAAKILSRAGVETGPRKLYTWFSDNGWAFRRGGRWQAMQSAINAGFLVERVVSGYFDEKTGERKSGDPQVRVTAKGLQKMRDLLAPSAELRVVQ